MKGEKTLDRSKKAYGSSTMSDFFRHYSVEERRAVYQMAASVAINEQKDVIRAAKAREPQTPECK